MTLGSLEYMELDNEMGKNEMEILMERQQWVEHNDSGSKNWKGSNGLPMEQWQTWNGTQS